MALEENIQKLMSAQQLTDYDFLVGEGLTTPEELAKLRNAVSDTSRRKYNESVKGLYEMSVVREILNRVRIEGEAGLVLVRESRKKQKPHIGVALLQPWDRYKISVEISPEELEDLVKEFVWELSCPDYFQGICLHSCRYNMQATEDFDCYTTITTSKRLLEKYLGIDEADKAMIRIWEYPGNGPKSFKINPEELDRKLSENK